MDTAGPAATSSATAVGLAGCDKSAGRGSPSRFRGWENSGCEDVTAAGLFPRSAALFSQFAIRQTGDWPDPRLRFLLASVAYRHPRAHVSGGIDHIRFELDAISHLKPHRLL